LLKIMRFHSFLFLLYSRSVKLNERRNADVKYAAKSILFINRETNSKISN
jgi:hypothetical protein